MISVKEIRELGIADTVSKKQGIYTLRREFFYRNGMDADKFAANIKRALPGIEILSFGEHWAPFRGGASTANSSHWWVKFKEAEPVRPASPARTCRFSS